MGDGIASDAEVITASLDDPELFAEIFRRHHAAVFAYAVRCVGQSQGEEVASDVFAEAFAVGSVSTRASPLPVPGCWASPVGWWRTGIAGGVGSRVLSLGTDSASKTPASRTIS